MDKSVLPGVNVVPEQGWVGVGMLLLAKENRGVSPVSSMTNETVGTLVDI